MPSWAGMGAVVDPEPLRQELLADLDAAHESTIADLRTALAAADDAARRTEIAAEISAAERSHRRARRTLRRGFGATTF
jgi:hypothetical protein